MCYSEVYSPIKLDPVFFQHRPNVQIGFVVYISMKSPFNTVIHISLMVPNPISFFFSNTHPKPLGPGRLLRQRTSPYFPVPLCACVCLSPCCATYVHCTVRARKKNLKLSGPIPETLTLRGKNPRNKLLVDLPGARVFSESLLWITEHLNNTFTTEVWRKPFVHTTRLVFTHWAVGRRC